MINRYYILPLPNEHSALWSIVVEKKETVRKNLLGNKMIVKLYSGDDRQHGILNGFTEYTHEGILTYLAEHSAEWQEDING